MAALKLNEKSVVEAVELAGQSASAMIRDEVRDAIQAVRDVAATLKELPPRPEFDLIARAEVAQVATLVSVDSKFLHSMRLELNTDRGSNWLDLDCRNQHLTPGRKRILIFILPEK